jgi:hypothetical protein
MSFLIQCFKLKIRYKEEKKNRKTRHYEYSVSIDRMFMLTTKEIHEKDFIIITILKVKSKIEALSYGESKKEMFLIKYA